MQHTFRINLRSSYDDIRGSFQYYRARQISSLAEQQVVRTGATDSLSLQFTQVPDNHPYVHLQGLKQVAQSILIHELLRLRTGYDHIILLQEGGDVLPRDLGLRLHPVL